MSVRRPARGRHAVVAAVVAVCLHPAVADTAADIEAVRARLMRPHADAAAGTVDREGLDGRVLCGYQGWFTVPGDGADLGWRHWRIRDASAPDGSRVAVDLLPDVSELGPDERFPLGLSADGRPVEIFSSHVRATVHRHFRWMKDHGIDGVFVQRFAEGLRDPRVLAHHTTVLGHCRDAAVEHGRVYAVMYDLTGMPAGGAAGVIDDWRNLRRRMRIGDDPAALLLAGRPLVAVWGVGFADGRAYGLAECRDLVATLAAEGSAVLVGVPTGWRTGDRDAVADPLLHEIVSACAAVCPWTVGRYATPDDVVRHADRDWAADLAWCRDRGVTYVPVIFPGFSWHNLKGGPLGEIPRRRGEFFSRQADEAARVGARSLFVAMFDEVDEGTAIFKCAEPPPGLENRFLSLEGLPGDHYLRLAGAAGRRLRGSDSGDRARTGR